MIYNSLNGKWQIIQRNGVLLLSAVILTICAVVCSGQQQKNAVDNSATKATISSNAQFNNSYNPKYVADGKIPAPGSGNDAAQAWCLPQNISTNAWISFTWKEPVKVAAVVYWGRTAFQDIENFSACKVYVDDAAEPITIAKLKKGPHGQVIELPKKVTAKSIRLVFPSNFGGSNPGASEIGIFDKVPDKKMLETFKNGNTLASPEILKRASRGQFGFTKLLMTQRHPVNSSHVYTYHQEGLRPGGGLWVADFTSGEIEMNRILDSTDGQILDATLHYNGTKVLFSWKRTMEDKFQLYTIDVDGENLMQVSNHDSNNFNACWLPDGDIVFLSDRKPAFAYCWKTTTPILWRCNSDGSNARRISSNYLNDFTPAVLENGRIVFSRWEYVDRPAIPIQSLWTINPDGTKLEGLFGNRSLSPATFMDAREIPGSDVRILCVLTSHNGPCRGAIGIVDPRLGANSQDAITNLTPEVNIGNVNSGDGNHIRGPYLNPFPINDRFFLVSKAGAIQLRDYKGKMVEPLISKIDGIGFYCPQPIVTRKKERLVASSLESGTFDSQDNWATMMMQNVYNGLGDDVEPGSIKKLAIVQEMEKPLGIDPSLRAFGFQFPVVSCGATYAPKKIWGYATVEPDGSANFKVPAQKPIYFLPLDENGMAVQRMRTFTHLMPGEVQSCVGCHANRNYATAKTTEQVAARPTAMLRKTQQLQKPQWGVNGFSYPHLVQPVLDRHCANCHTGNNPKAGLELSADKTDYFNVSYENLVRKGTSTEPSWIGGVGGRFVESKYTSWIPTYNGQEENILEIEPGRWGAKASLLAHIVKTGHPDKEGNKRINLTDNEKRRIYAWLDLNCPYYGTSDSNYRNLQGCRQQLPNGFTEMMNDVGKRRCASCHQNAGKDNNWVFKLPGNFYVRLDNPQLNNFMKAPLAKTAGGTGKCDKPVFANTDDADYVKIMESFDQLKNKLDQHPRIDMMNISESSEISVNKPSQTAEICLIK